MRTASNQARKHWRGLENGFNQVRTCQFGSGTRTSLVRPFFSCQFLICMPLLGCHVSGICSKFFQDARRRSADDALSNGKREIYLKGSRIRYLATRGGMALRHWNSIESSWCRILGGHSPHVGEPLGAPLCSGVHGEQEGLVPRCARETLQTKRIESH